MLKMDGSSGAAIFFAAFLRTALRTAFFRMTLFTASLRGPRR